MSSVPGSPRTKSETSFVSFSGIDGAGKSTQIQALCAAMWKEGRRVRVIRFWDDIARLTGIREATGHKIFKGDKGIGSPSAPINRRDKNVRSWPMTMVRLFLYFVDALSTRTEVKKALRSEDDLIIFDRYVHDELANLTLHNPVIRTYVRMIARFVPKPQIAFLLDADPVKARERKPEYPLEFLHTNRQSYLALNELVGGMTVIAPMPVHQVEHAVLSHVQRACHFGSPRASDLPSGDTGVKTAAPDGITSSAAAL
jgi:thymidylate kinase